MTANRLAVLALAVLFAALLLLGCQTGSEDSGPSVDAALAECADCECVGCEVCNAGDCCCADALPGPVMVGVDGPATGPSGGAGGGGGGGAGGGSPGGDDDPDGGAPGPAFSEPMETTSRDGNYVVRVAHAPDPIPFNQPFELRVDVLDADGGQPLADSTVAVAGWMPDHGHGMTRFPRVEVLADGRFAVHGMLFHMLGLWEIQVDVLHDGVSSRADLEVVLE